MTRASSPPSVAVLIVTRDRCRDVLETLAGVAALDYPPDRLEVLVVDNGSCDGTEAAVHDWLRSGGARLARGACLRSTDNLGAAAARNLLAAKASPASEAWLFLDDDAVPGPGILGPMLAALDGAAVGAVGARIVAYEAPGRDLSGAGWINRRLGRLRETPTPAATDCDFVTSCAMAVRPDAFRTVGGFDEDYFVYHEDVDFCLRLVQRGYRVRYEPAAVARHKVPPGKRRAPERLYYLARNKLLLLRRHLPWRRHPGAWLASGVSLIPRMLLESVLVHRGLARDEIRAILAAGRDALRGAKGPWPG
ncbi:MAG: glycosyltransferase family 2 protein [Candidatus Rokuibacteriota bacterium]